MAEVGVTLATENFNAFDAEAEIAGGDDVLRGNGRGEAGPAGAGFEFILRRKDGVAAADATVETGAVFIPIEVVERVFG